MKTKTVFAALLFGGSLSAHAAGIVLDLGLCDKTPDLKADAPPRSPAPKAKKPAAAKTQVAPTAGTAQHIAGDAVGAAASAKGGSALAR